MVAKNSGHIDVSGIKPKPLESIDDLQNEVCRDLFRYWDGKKASGGFDTPDLINIPEVVPYLVILDLVDDAPTFRFRMSGQAIVEASGQDLTGKLLDVTGQEAPLTLKFCEAVVMANGPVFSDDAFTITFVGETLRFNETVALPVLNGDNTLSQILLAHGPVV